MRCRDLRMKRGGRGRSRVWRRRKESTAWLRREERIEMGRLHYLRGW